ncbi:hypothetical protein ACTFIW_013299, partial [Dictyostelium discoideum]
GGQI